MPFFDEQRFTSLFTTAFRSNGLSGLLSKETVHSFYALTEHLLTVNEQFNLTAIRDLEGIVYQHYVDCAIPAARLPKGARIIDVGCGAGFPSLPIALLRPDVHIHAVDSTAKKVRYVQQTAATFGLSHLTCEVTRAEDLGKGATRESYDIAIARAVADLRVLCELCLPLVRVGGRMIAMKGKQAAFELQGAKKAMAVLGGRAAPIEDIRIETGGEALSHPLIYIDKITRTPQSYPRPYTQISKKPL